MTLSNRRFIQQFAIALAAISSAVTCIAFLYQDEINSLLNGPEKIVVFGTIIILCLLYACYMTPRKSKVSFDINPNFRLTVERGDIFEKKGIIVIPVNEYFDTHVGDGIISASSVHGKWINRYFADSIPKLDSILNEKLDRFPYTQVDARYPGKNKQYRLGTFVDIELNDSVYVLIALTHFDKNNHAYVKRWEYAEVLDCLMKHIHDMDADDSIYMPLIGTGLSRLQRNPQRILNFMVDEIDFKYSGFSFPKGINIEIYDIESVNLTDLEIYFENGLAL